MTPGSTAAATWRVGDACRRRLASVLVLACVAMAVPAADQLPDAAQLDQEYTTRVRPLLETYCIDCHGGAKPKGSLHLDTLERRIGAGNVADWTRARNVLDVSSMPPKEEAQPRPEERERLRRWIADSIARFESDHLESQGNVLLRRINLRAYQNMVQTLTGLRPDVSDFQHDGSLHHFDTAGTAIFLTQDQFTQFFACAERTLADAAAARAAAKKEIDAEIDFRAWRQVWYVRDQYQQLERGIAAHSKDLASFSGIRADGDLAPCLANIIDPKIAAHYGRKTFAEVVAARIDWEHDPDCQREVIARLTEADAKFKQRLSQVSEFQPLLPSSGFQPEYCLPVQIEIPGTYEFSARLRTFKAGCAMPIKFLDSGRTVGSVLVEAPPDAPQTYSAKAYLARGKHIISIASTLPLFSEIESHRYYVNYLKAHFGIKPAVGPFYIGAPLYLDDRASIGADEIMPAFSADPCELVRISKLKLHGPSPEEAAAPALAEALALGASDAPSRENAERSLLAFMKRAYAGAGDDAMAKPYVEVVMAHFARNKDFTAALTYGLAAVLSSPRFLFLEEAQRGDALKRRPLAGRELARRLAYFLWSDLPDAELQAAAESGALRDQRQLAAQVRRLLKDPRSSSFRDAFTAQWLRIDRLDSIVIPYELHPGFDTSLLESAKRESVAFFSEILDHDLSVLNFIDSDFVVVNNRLADHYGIPGVAGTEFRRVALPPGTHRGGVLGQASVLIATANGMTSSLVRRGAFIMEQLLGMPPGVPPPNVPALNEVTGEGADGAPLTQAQRLAQHRSIASCARCHDRIDPLGIGLENFDAIGGWGDQMKLLVTAKDGKQAWVAHAAEVAGKLPDGGEAYDGADALRACLKKQPDRFLRRLAENLLIYALGRDLQRSDGPTLDAICARVAKSGYGLSTLIEQLVLSEQFVSK